MDELFDAMTRLFGPAAPGPYVAGTEPTGFEEGIIGNCRWRLFGPECDSRARGELHLAYNPLFDRWANSRTVCVEMWGLYFEWGGQPNMRESLEEIVRRAVSTYNTAI